eukprot:179549-Chlamydomonas_euryale.AAC.2
MEGRRDGAMGECRGRPRSKPRRILHSDFRGGGRRWAQHTQQPLSTQTTRARFKRNLTLPSIHPSSFTRKSHGLAHDQRITISSPHTHTKPIVPVSHAI